MITAQRILAVLAAILLVGSVALATLGPPGIALGQAVFLLDRRVLNGLHDGIAKHLAPWVWDGMILPVLIRPVWLVPACVGILCAGVALTLSNTQQARTSRRRRS